MEGAVSSKAKGTSLEIFHSGREKGDMLSNHLILDTITPS